MVTTIMSETPQVEQFKGLIERFERNKENKWKALDPAYVYVELQNLVKEFGREKVLEIRDAYAKSGEENLKLGKPKNLFIAAEEYAVAATMSGWLLDEPFATDYYLKSEEINKMAQGISLKRN